MKKRKMSCRKFNTISGVIAGFLMVLLVVLNYFANAYAMTLDTYLGKGEKKIEEAENVASAEYYEVKYNSPEETQAAGAELTKTLAGEGIILLKNDGSLPVTEDTAVTPFGYRFVEPLYGGSGSGGMNTEDEYIISAEDALRTKFSNVNEDVISAMKAAEAEYTLPLVGASGGEDNYSGQTTVLFEYNAQVYSGLEDSCKGTTGLVYIGRVGGEGADLEATAYEDGTPHELALTQDEKDMITFAEANCDKVVVIVESSNVMELGELEADEKINAVVWAGGLGSTGFSALSDILTGDIVPSAKTVDIYPADLTKDPSYANYDTGTEAFTYSNAGNAFHEYEEGIYVGYKYYETAAYEAEQGNFDGFDYDAAVVYPFGYGLSYTTFEQQITDFKDDGDNISVTVSVKNTGDTYAGKDIVQVYYTAPYTDYDKENKIEKSTVVLAGFAKTDNLNPGETQEVTVSFAKEDMASYSYTRDNGDGTTGCYILEAGDYDISLRSDSHTVIDSKTVNVAETVYYDNSNPRQSEKDAQAALDDEGNALDYVAAAEADESAQFVAATNQFESGSAYMNDDSIGKATILSRTDWAGTQPTAPTEEDRAASEQVLKWAKENAYGSFDPETDEELGNVEGSKVYTDEMPVSGADNGITLSDLRGKSYYDPLWDDLLDELDYSDTTMWQSALFKNGYVTGEIPEIGKPASSEKDGPQGLTQNDNDGNSWLSTTCAYTSEPIIASSWNTELAYEFGAAVGQEALQQDVNGWYAPGANTHRSAFGGRNFEYYSEDALLSGKMCASVVSGAGDNGLYCTIKHFVLNDQENHRDTTLMVWATEQTYRETYLRGFEIAVKEARKTVKYIDENGNLAEKVMKAGDGLMAGFAAIGKDWCGTSYELMTNVVRKEWGFTGFIITDMAIGTSDDFCDKMVRAGTDSLMCIPLEAFGMKNPNAIDYTSATGRTALRKAVKDLCYVQANSNMMQGVAPGKAVTYSMAPWRIGLYVADAVILAIIVGLIVWIAVRTSRAKKECVIKIEE